MEDKMDIIADSEMKTDIIKYLSKRLEEEKSKNLILRKEIWRVRIKGDVRDLRRAMDEATRVNEIIELNRMYELKGGTND